jgi:peptidyl-prolyl cis-trans isomerase A (cyclophilin A)
MLAAAAGRSRAAPRVVRTRVETEAGALVVEIDPEVAPITVANYLALVDARLLDGGAVYRVVTPANQPADTPHKIEVVQWGMTDPTTSRRRGRRSPTRRPGRPGCATSTARCRWRARPGTATTEFFVCIGAQPELDFGGRRNPTASASPRSAASPKGWT